MKASKNSSSAFQIIEKKFFERAAPLVAKDLLGKYLVRKIGGQNSRQNSGQQDGQQNSEESQEIAYMITETEAYEGLDDLASHASKGKTPRTEVMFGEPGIFYVYLIYGMYDLLNIVTGTVGYPSAVLIRATKEVSGPGRLTKRMRIDRNFNLKPAVPASGLWFEDRGVNISSKKIKKSPRIGVDYAGPIWAAKEWRFFIEEN